MKYRKRILSQDRRPGKPVGKYQPPSPGDPDRGSTAGSDDGLRSPDDQDHRDGSPSRRPRATPPSSSGSRRRPRRRSTIVGDSVVAHEVGDGE
jgi:hypothetical protein